MVGFEGGGVYWLVLGAEEIIIRIEEDLSLGGVGRGGKGVGRRDEGVRKGRRRGWESE